MTASRENALGVVSLKFWGVVCKNGVCVMPLIKIHVLLNVLHIGELS